MVTNWVYNTTNHFNFNMCPCLFRCCCLTLQNHTHIFSKYNWVCAAIFDREIRILNPESGVSKKQNVENGYNSYEIQSPFYKFVSIVFSIAYQWLTQRLAGSCWSGFLLFLNKSPHFRWQIRCILIVLDLKSSSTQVRILISHYIINYKSPISRFAPGKSPKSVKIGLSFWNTTDGEELDTAPLFTFFIQYTLMAGWIEQS